MASKLISVSFDAADPARLARFWADLLGREITERPTGPLLRGDETQLGLAFVSGSLPKVGQNRVHLHLTSASDAEQQRTVQAALGLGARHIDVGQLPDEGHVVLADPEDNEFCVIEAGNRFLAGCGFVGELACDGTRELGLFWSAALEWPLVWDRDEETAVQAPAGGTKVAWGGPPVAPKTGTNRQRLELAPTDHELAAEIDRLVELGAARLEAPDRGAVVLADPDGNEFWLVSDG